MENSWEKNEHDEKSLEENLLDENFVRKNKGKFKAVNSNSIPRGTKSMLRSKH